MCNVDCKKLFYFCTFMYQLVTEIFGFSKKYVLKEENAYFCSEQLDYTFQEF